MVQPKTPPLSVRLSSEVLARIDRVVQESGWTRNAAIGRLVELGAEAFDAMPKYVVKSGEAPAKPVTLDTPLSGWGDIQAVVPEPKAWKGGHPKPTRGKK